MMSARTPGLVSTREEVTVMILATIVQFACGFAMLALVFVGCRDIWDGSITLGQLASLPLSFTLMGVTGAKAMMVIMRPNRTAFYRVLALGAMAILPLVLTHLPR